MNSLYEFIGKSQYQALEHAMDGEEKRFFIDKLAALANLVAGMPKTYEQDGLGDDAIVYLHYFKGSMDWYIIERDMDTDGEGQIQAFGLADFGEGGELGYISIAELIAENVELDLYFPPCSLGNVKAKGKIS